MSKFLQLHIFIIFIGVLIMTCSLTVSAVPGDVELGFNAGAFTYPGNPPRVKAIVVQPDDKILIGGIFTTVGGTARNFIARLNPNGTLDSSFNAPLQTFGNTSGHVLAIALQPDGKILVGGAFFVNSDFTIMVRLNPDGSLDSSFNIGVCNQSVSTIVLQPDGKIIIGGDFGLINNVATPNLVRLNPNGMIDTQLGAISTLTGRVETIALQPNGKILIGGTFFFQSQPSLNNVARLNTNGTIDSSFNVGNGADSGVFAFTIQPDGKILVGGGFHSINSVARNGVARLNESGSVDTTFAPMLFQGSIIYSMFVQTDRKIFMVGNFGVVNGTVRVCLARLNEDGTLDSFYPTGAPNGANNIVWATTRQPDNKYLIGGDFTTVAGISRPQLARLDDLPPHKLADFDGDGRADLSVFRPTDRVWYINGSRVGFYGIQWGLATDKLTPADYDGDGKNDIAVWREVPALQASFYILRSSDFTVRVEQFGQTGDIALAGDFDGDGKSDIAVYRNGAPSTFFYRASLNNPGGNTTFLQWGVSGDVPVAGDYDGDGKTDAAVFRPSNNTWYALYSSNLLPQTTTFGLNTDKLVPADYDGDGRTDIAVFRGGIWWVLGSATGAFGVAGWGLAGDTPVPADYDGDGRTDIAIYRNGVWWILQSSNGFPVVRTFGLATDLPVPAAYNR